METELIVKPTISRDQVELIKKTVAIGATDDELKLFLYQAEKRGLDPLTRQIHFIKRKRWNDDTKSYDEVGTIQTGIDGFRLIADRTGKLGGIKRGVITGDNGELLRAWAEVYRNDWKEPAREEVSFKEYCQKKKDGEPMGLWKTMPETMLKKVAEAAALRMAFPENLSGLYSDDEMSQADAPVKVIKAEPMIEPDATANMPVDKIEVQPSIDEQKKRWEDNQKAPITEPQRKKIFAAGKQMGYSEGVIHDIIQKRYKVEHTNELTKQQATELIDKIEAGATIGPDGEWVI